jgi:hypothetical protein
MYSDQMTRKVIGLSTLKWRITADRQFIQDLCSILVTITVSGSKGAHPCWHLRIYGDIKAYSYCPLHGKLTTTLPRLLVPDSKDRAHLSCMCRSTSTSHSLSHRLWLERSNSHLKTVINTVLCWKLICFGVLFHAVLVQTSNTKAVPWFKQPWVRKWICTLIEGWLHLLRSHSPQYPFGGYWQWTWWPNRR